MPATEAAFKRAAHVVALDTQVQRVTGVPMEPRAAVGDYDARAGRYTLHAGSGNVVRQKVESRSSSAWRERGARSNARRRRQFRHPQRLLSGIRAGVLGGAAAGTAGEMDLRAAESFLSDYQGRDLASQAELALDADGHFLALRGQHQQCRRPHRELRRIGKGVELDVERL